MKTKILHLIPSLDLGGAESMLSKLVGRLDPELFESCVLTMAAEGPLPPQVRASGIDVSSLQVDRSLPNPLAVVRLVRFLRRYQPHILQTWLYHADLLGTLGVMLNPGPSLIWNIRCTDFDMNRYGWKLKIVRSVNARLSWRPELVVVNSESGRRVHEQIGFRPQQWDVIPNGFDTDQFKPDENARRQLRQGLGIGDDMCLVGIVARWDPQKGYGIFFKAARKLASSVSNIAFVCVGRDVTSDTPGLATILHDNSIDAPVHLLGPKFDMPSLYPAFDIFALSSVFGEGFPNVVGEAMACGVPCVVTDIGDSGTIVGDTGIVIPPGDPDALAAACERLISIGGETRQQMGTRARQRIDQNYGLEPIVEHYSSIYRNTALSHQHRH